jgi:uncharacterized protein
MSTNLLFSQNSITRFLSDKKLAFAGLSRNDKKFSRVILKRLLENGFSIYPVNPNASTINDLECYTSVMDLPEEVKTLYILANKKNSEAIFEQALQKGIPNIWIQQGSETQEILRLASEHGIQLIHGECLMMWLEPVNGAHAFHRFMRRVFHGMPSMN